MRKLPLMFVALTIFTQACSRKENSASDADTTAVASQEAVSQCFVYKENKDSAFLHLQIADGMASGELNYSLYEKDSNRGKLAGQLSGDTLFAKYTFMSEGQESVREIALLKTGNEWVEGFGEPVEKDGAMLLKSHASVRFDQGLVFKETPCP